MTAPSKVPPSNPLIVVLGICGGCPQSAKNIDFLGIHETCNVIKLGCNKQRKRRITYVCSKNWRLTNVHHFHTSVCCHLLELCRHHILV